MLFKHPKLGEDVNSISGHYVLTREGCLENHGQMILYFVGYAVADRSCCGYAGCGYAVVAGRIVSYGIDVTDDGRTISDVDQIDDKFYREVAEALREKEALHQVHFHCKDGGSRVLFTR